MMMASGPGRGTFCKELHQHPGSSHQEPPGWPLCRLSSRPSWPAGHDLGLAGWSQVEDQVVAWLRAADEYAAVGGVIDWGGGVADCSGHDGCLAGVAHSGAA